MGTLRLTNVSRRGVMAGCLVAGALVYSWIAAYFRPFTTPMNVAVAIPVLVVLAGIVRSWGTSQDRRARDLAHRHERHVAGTVWIGLVTLLVAWELIAYVSSPRHDHPTLSSIADDIMRVHPGRALMVALWLALGWSLFLRRPADRARAPSGQP